METPEFRPPCHAWFTIGVCRTEGHNGTLDKTHFDTEPRDVCLCLGVDDEDMNPIYCR